MARITLGGKTTLRLDTDLDVMFTDLYGIADFFATPSFTGASWKLRVDALGNLAIGMAPSSWVSGGNFQAGPFCATSSNQSLGSGEMVCNAFRDTSLTYKYNVANYAALYRQWDGKHVWYSAPSGTAGSAVSFTQVLSIDSAGNFRPIVQSAAPTLSINQEMSFQLVSNTSLKILVRGTDGVTRSATLTLS